MKPSRPHVLHVRADYKRQREKQVVDLPHVGFDALQRVVHRVLFHG